MSWRLEEGVGVLRPRHHLDHHLDGADAAAEVPSRSCPSGSGIGMLRKTASIAFARRIAGCSPSVWRYDSVTSRARSDESR